MTRFSLALSVLLDCMLVAGLAHAQTFTVTATQGSADIGKDRGSYQPATLNSSYTIPAWGKTDDGAYITISFAPENNFRLLPGSEAQVTTGGESDSGSAWHRVVKLKIGEASFNHNAGSAPVVHLDCETPTAVCGAVGTAYDVNATEGTYKVSRGSISVSSEEEGNNLKMVSVNSGSVTYAPGQQNTYSEGNFSGTVRIGGTTFHAADASFTVAKLAGSGTEIAVHISSGSLGDTGPGDYTLDGGSLKRVSGVGVGIHPKYLAAAREEGTLNVRRAADHAANRPFGQESALNAATARATQLRKELFNRETVREVNKQIIQSVIQNATRQAASAAAANAARGAVGH